MMQQQDEIIKGPVSHHGRGYECIILAGGLGTRLRTAVPDLPKCMAPVNEKPFLSHVIDYAVANGVTDFIFSLGYLHEYIEAFLKEKYPALHYKIAIENEPLGTGGAIMLASKKARQENVLVLNGDTMFKVNIQALMDFHLQHHSDCTLALKPMHKFDRYGMVEINQENHVQSFQEKRYYEEGLINGGVYVLNVPSFNQKAFSEKFSFEKDYLEKYVQSVKMMGMIQDEYFIDIGIPEDFERAGKELG